MRKELRITFINIGNGDAVLLEAPASNCRGGRFVMLVDGGSGEPEEYENSCTGRIRAVDFMEEEGIDHIDLMVNTHIHEDHTCGLWDVATRRTPSSFWQPFPENLYDSLVIPKQGEDAKDSLRKFAEALKSYQAICRHVKQSGGQVHQLVEDSIEFARQLPVGLKTWILGPDPMRLKKQTERLILLSDAAGLPELDREMNDVSICIRLEWCGRSILLPGDTDREGYCKQTELLKAHIFKVGHHGQANSLTPELAKAIAPSYAVICASSDRRYGSAAPEILAMLKESGTELYFTDCPDVKPYTQGLKPHRGVRFRIGEDGMITEEYLMDEWRGEKR